jgi:transcriptional regulator with XRE-family HTH domain
VANDIAQRLLARIRELREARGLTQESFAELAGLTYKHYQQVEAGRKSDIRLSTLVKMAGGLDLNLSELVDFDTPPRVLAEAKGNGFTVAPRKGAGKPATRRNRRT